MEISYTIFDLLFYLLLYAFLGWCVEVFCAAVKSGRFVNRGFLNLPLNMPCGIAAALLLPVLGTMNHKTILQYSHDAGDLHSGPVRDRPVRPGRQPEAVCRRAEGKDRFSSTRPPRRPSCCWCISWCIPA